MGCGLWCYVSDSNTCRDTRPSIFGAPYSWSCQACEQEEDTINVKESSIKVEEERGAPEDSGELFFILQGMSVVRSRYRPGGRIFRDPSDLC